MKHLTAVQALLNARPDSLVVSSLGTVTSALRSATEDGPHLYLGGAMGSALPAAMGVAAKRAKLQVLAILGDGELVMGAGALWSLAAAKPPNLLVAVLADGYYSITGGQRLPAPASAAIVGESLGLRTASAASPSEIKTALDDLPPVHLIEVVITEREWPGPSAFVDPANVRARFERSAAAKQEISANHTDGVTETVGVTP